MPLFITETERVGVFFLVFKTAKTIPGTSHTALFLNVYCLYGIQWGQCGLAHMGLPKWASPDKAHTGPEPAQS